MIRFVLIHSPLVGPLTWSLVAREIQQKGLSVIVPALSGVDEAKPPYWKQHVDAVALAVELASPDSSLILVGHSGAGVLLPIIRQTLRRPVAAYVFVDAIIPKDGASRLDLFESSEAAEQFRKSASGGLLPTWSDDDLQGVIENTTIRQCFVAELRPLPLAVYEEPIPVFDDWPDAPCGYLSFSPVYKPLAKQAQMKGWACAEIDGGHFHMLVDPSAVATALFGLVEQMGIVIAGV